MLKIASLALGLALAAATTAMAGAVIPNAGHWVMEENPADTVKAVTNFLN